ncbi:MAG: carbon-nitrogen hydrolase [Geopsychrobacter sp.]|nr:carbon-nitrogen hydrolase [Geopsychrobacter sp.]
MKTALLQQTAFAERHKNIAATTQKIRHAAQSGAQLVLLQELHNSLYFCQTEKIACFDLAETIPGPSTDYFSRLAAELNIVLVLSLFEKRCSGLYHNTAVVLETNGSIAGCYRKMHIPDDPGFYEKFYFTEGDLGLNPVQTSLGKLGVLICWDQWFPEAARLMALAGAEILIYPTAIGWDPADSQAEQKRQLEAWQIVQRGQAIANGLPLVAINRCGTERACEGDGQIDFWGHSFACGPQGEMLGQTGQQTETLFIEIDLARSEEVRRIWPFLRDRRIDAYADLLKRFRN